MKTLVRASGARPPQVKKAEGESLRLFLFWTLLLGGGMVIGMPTWALMDSKLEAAQVFTALMAAGLGLSYLAGDRKVPNGFFLPSLAALFLAWIFSPISQASLVQAGGFLLLAWLCAGVGRQGPDLEKLARCWLIVACVQSAYAVAQRFGLDFTSATFNPGSHSRAMADFGNPNFLAACLVVVWPLTFLVESTWSKGVWGIRLLLLAALVATGSRAGLLAVVLQIFLLGRQRWVLVVPVLLGGLAFLAQWTRPTLRLEVWIDSMALWSQRPWTGWGPGTFPLAMQQSLSTGLQGKLAATNQFVEHPHNFVLLFLCELGILGLAAFAWTLYSAFRPLSLPDTNPSKRILWVAVAGLLFENLFDRNLVLASSAFFFWSLVGLQAGSQPYSPRRSLPAWGAAALGLCLMGLGGFYGWSAWKSFDSYGQATAPDFMQKDLGWAKSQEALARSALGFDNSDPMQWQSLGESLAKQGDYASASEMYRQALKLAPGSVSAAINLGNCLFQLQKFPEAEAAYRHALAVDPASVDAHFDLGYCLFYQRRLKEAADEFDTVLKLHPGDAKATKMKEQILQ